MSVEQRIREYENVPKTTQKSSEKSSEKILNIIHEYDKISAKEISEKLGISSRGVEKNIMKLKREGLLERVGPDKGGYWKITKK